MKSFIGENVFFEEAALEALISGYDILILPSNRRVSLKILEYLYGNLDNSEFRKAIDRSFEKVIKVKRKLISDI